MKYTILALALFSATAFAQTTPVTPDTEKLTSSEELALKYVGQEFNQAQQDLARLGSDVAKAHPGYTLNPNTGTLVKEAAKAAPVAIPEAAPKPEVKSDAKPEKKK
jgi:hypothetical protein